MVLLPRQPRDEANFQAAEGCHLPQGKMNGRWNIRRFVFQLHNIFLVASILVLCFQECLSINDEGLALLDFRPKVEGDSHGALKNWNQNYHNPCTWSSVYCTEGKVESLLLSENNVQSSKTLFEKPNRLPEQKYDQILFSHMLTRIRLMNRKVRLGLKFESSLSHDDGERQATNVPSFPEPSMPQYVYLTNSARRYLLRESSNLPAAPVSISPPQEAVDVLSIGSGSFPAVPISNSVQSADSLPEVPTGGSESTSDNNAQASDLAISEDNGGQGNKLLILILPATAILITLIAGSVMWQRQQATSPIGPWKTGLSGPLQKAFVAGVPKLHRTELEAACEDFSNIITTQTDCTVFKGTLSSGVEISVVSTAIASKDWSKRTDSYFRSKVDTLSRVNHKNFVNLLGYCEENEPFMRMMAFEYAPNGTLFEHLHVKEFEHLDWASRMRIIMGTAYCLEYIHHELNPPVTIGDLQSSSVYLTDDYAAKVCDCSMWAELSDRRIKPEGEETDPSASSTVHSSTNVYSFGLLMLEIISGKPCSEQEGSILNWATEYLNDTQNFKYLVDPSLRSFKDEELEVVCEAIQECIHGDNTNRPTMKEIVTKLKEVLGILPEAAIPRLSPLWWAELEILSVEAS